MLVLSDRANEKQWKHNYLPDWNSEMPIQPSSSHLILPLDIFRHNTKAVRLEEASSKTIKEFSCRKMLSRRVKKLDTCRLSGFLPNVSGEQASSAADPLLWSSHHRLRRIERSHLLWTGTFIKEDTRVEKGGGLLNTKNEEDGKG